MEKEWIESPGGWAELDDQTKSSNSNDEEDDDAENYRSSGAVDLFTKDTDSSQDFHFEVVVNDDDNNTTTKTIRVSGYELYSDETAKSTGVTLWEGSIPLAKYIQTQSSTIIRNKQILELGAGLGLCGIVAYHLGAQNVVLTDGDTNTLKQMRYNVKKNCNSGSSNNTISCQQLLWTDKKEDLPSFQKSNHYDIILASDVIYTPESIIPLFSTVKAMLRPNDDDDTSKNKSKFIMSWYTRVNEITIHMILDIAKTQKLVLLNEEATNNNIDDGIFIFEHY